MNPRRIETADDLADAAAWLARREPRFAPALARIGRLPLRLRPPGFATLLEVIASQQVSTASADAGMARLRAAGLDQQAEAAAAGAAGLRAAGLTRQKAAHVAAIARSDFDFAALADLPDAEVLARLQALKGIGPWTAEIYATFALGRPDIFAAGDLALRIAAHRLFGLALRPTEPELRIRAENWSPWRAVAARVLWAYYRLDP